MLNIRIEGLAGTGKTALAGVITKALREAGYTVATYDEAISGSDQPVHDMEQYIPAQIDNRKVKIKVRTS